MDDQGCGRESSPQGFRRQFLTDTRACKLRGKYETITKRCVLSVKFLTVPDTNNLIVNIELTKITVTIRINLKWHNLNYSSCQLVGRPHLRLL